MTTIESVWYLYAILLFPVAVYGADAVYKSVDKAGRVTYSSEPPKDAVKVEGVRFPREPSEQDRKAAREHARAVEQKTDARYQTLKERSRRAAQARKEAQRTAERERLAREEAERQQRIDETLDWLANERAYDRGYPHNRLWPYWPPRPVYPSPHPPHPSIRLNRPYVDHINTPARNH